MNYTEFIQRLVIAAAPQMFPVTIDSPTEAHIVDAAESLAAELVKRGHLQPTVKCPDLLAIPKDWSGVLPIQDEPEPLPEAAPERRKTCASCFYCGTGMWCSKHDEYVNPGSTCASYE